MHAMLHVYDLLLYDLDAFTLPKKWFFGLYCIMDECVPWGGRFRAVDYTGE